MISSSVNVQIVGPGIWYVLHKLSANAQTASTVKTFTDFLTFLAEYFPCEECRSHIQKFLMSHPLIEYKDIVDDSGKNIGYLQMTWFLHSLVNKRLGKPFFSFEDAKLLYFAESCKEECPGLIQETTPTPPSTNRSIKQKIRIN